MKYAQEKKEIKSREEVSTLVRTFYSRIRKEETLGPIFEEIIDDWEEHFELLTDFWESNLFHVRKYYGNPMLAHVSVDKKNDHSIESMHFGIWLNLWYQTIDDLFEGQVAELAKFRARKMSTNLFLAMYHHRPQKEEKS